MKIYKYESYEKYVEAQTKANVKKLRNVWVRQATVEKIVNENLMISSVLCHGTRNAREQEYFKKLLPFAEIVGTEISHTASQFPMTEQHDFHEPKNKWLNKFDIVYSNSFDHSYDPEKCINTWKDQLSSNGSLYIEWAWDPSDNRSRASDPLELSEEELLELCSSAGLKLISSFEQDKGQAKIYRFKK